MGFFKYLWSLFGGNSTAAQAARIEISNDKIRSSNQKIKMRLDDPEYPMDVAINRAVEIDSVTLGILKNKTSFLIPTLNEQQVSAIGKIDVGQGVTLYRIYLDDGVTWIQFTCSGGVTEDSIDEIGVFSYNKAENPSSEAALSILAGKDSNVGLPSITFDGNEYLREWGSEEGQTELIPYEEFVVNEEGERYSVQHQAMLYTRSIPGTVRNELLLISVEESETEDGEQDICVSTSVGVTLQSTDLKIT